MEATQGVGLGDGLLSSVRGEAKPLNLRLASQPHAPKVKVEM